MAISNRRRQSLPASKVGYPKSSRVGGKGRNSYPLDTKKRAQSALRLSGKSNTAGSYRTIERKVNRLYPSITTRHHKGK